ncbi:hypothetical protein QEH52_15695 [Coraliomargarita sp. SDUM461003]|uniref:Transposase n=1 Tax=Thalassobacterium maritimum TaxID=3041265 RepID=A0ABU1AXS6_9BACT|nr:hypothetical protein [Coraliomargarita sp. SDUM461003]MDQ8208969.1 hypothetical protein [Coraliomargarita sp. SDUM461003]
MNTAKNTHTIGIDLGDKSHQTCTLNAEGEIIERTTLLNNQPELIRFSKANQAPLSSWKPLAIHHGLAVCLTSAATR